MATWRCLVVITLLGGAFVAGAATALPFSLRTLETPPLSVALEMQGGTALRYELALTNVGSPALIFTSLCNIDSGVCQPANGCNNVTRGVGQGCASFGTVPGSSITGALQAHVILVAAPSARRHSSSNSMTTSGSFGLLSSLFSSSFLSFSPFLPSFASSDMNTTSLISATVAPKPIAAPLMAATVPSRGEK